MVDSNFSLLDKSMDSFHKEVEAKKELLSAPPFPDSEMTEAKRKKRVERACKDYWYFDKEYFPSDMYSDGYSESSVMHKDIVKFCQTNGVHIVFGPRGEGKTVTGKKVLIWLLITGAIRLAGTYAETSDKAEGIMLDVAELIKDNARIVNDFKPEFLQKNDEQVKFRLRGIGDGRYRYIKPYCEGRSVKGYGKQFDRPQFLLGDDVETLESSMQPEAVKKRIDKLSEAYLSLAENVRTFIIFGNDFDRNSALHRIREEQDKGILTPGWSVHVYQAWDEKKNRPMWKERYKEKTEAALKLRLQPKDESDWQSNFQQNPMPTDGFFFRREFYQEWVCVPLDARGVIYCDPNLSEKGHGDTTGVTALKFSVKTMKFYVVGARCKSFSSSTDLLDALLDIRDKFNVKVMGFDGHVTQESSWKDNIRNWCRIRRYPYPQVEFKRYNIDDLAKNAQMAYEMGDVLFPPGFALTPEGKTYTQQFFAFRGKKAKKKDDAPDSLIGAFELLHERKMIKRGRNLLATEVSMVNDGGYRF